MTGLVEARAGITLFTQALGLRDRRMAVRRKMGEVFVPALTSAMRAAPSPDDVTGSDEFETQYRALEALTNAYIDTMSPSEAWALDGALGYLYQRTEAGQRTAAVLGRTSADFVPAAYVEDAVRLFSAARGGQQLPSALLTRVWCRNWEQDRRLQRLGKRRLQAVTSGASLADTLMFRSWLKRTIFYGEAWIGSFAARAVDWGACGVEPHAPLTIAFTDRAMYLFAQGSWRDGGVRRWTWNYLANARRTGPATHAFAFTNVHCDDAGSLVVTCRGTDFGGLLGDLVQDSHRLPLRYIRRSAGCADPYRQVQPAPGLHPPAALRRATSDD